MDKLQKCFSQISLLVNERNLIDSIILKLPKDKRIVNYWQYIKKTPRVDALIFDFIQIGKAEQLRLARTFESIQDRFGTEEKTANLFEGMIESLMKIEQLYFQQSDAMKALYPHSKRNGKILNK